MAEQGCTCSPIRLCWKYCILSSWPSADTTMCQVPYAKLGSPEFLATLEVAATSPRE